LDGAGTDGDGSGAGPPLDLEVAPPVPLVDLADETERRAVTRLAVVESGSTGPSSDYVRMYLKEIGKVSLLTGEQEVDLARRVESGLYAAERLAAIKERGALDGVVDDPRALQKSV